MLVLTRKIGEVLWIESDIKVQVLGVRSGQVRLGIDAPASVKVLREEIVKNKTRSVGKDCKRNDKSLPKAADITKKVQQQC